jgi:hypothetical protein
MKVKLNASSRLKAGWWDDLSDAAKKAYKKLHPNSKFGGGGSSGGSSKKEALDRARKEHKDAADAVEQIDKRLGDPDTRTDEQWEEYHNALDNLRNKTKNLKKHGGIKRFGGFK